MPIKFNGITIFDDSILATKTWVQSQLGDLNMLGRMNFDAAINGNLTNGQSYTIPSKGYVSLLMSAPGYSNGSAVSSTVSIRINGVPFASITSTSAHTATQTLIVPVSAGDIISIVVLNAGSCGYTFAPQI